MGLPPEQAEQAKKGGTVENPGGNVDMLYSVRRWGWAAATGLALAVLMSAPTWAAGVPDFTQYGFPDVVAKTTVTPTAAATLTAGDITVKIPAGAFSTPVTFELLENQNSYWQAKAPAGQDVLANFAFKVINTSTGQLVGAFNAPVMFTLTDSAVSPHSTYYDISTTGTFTANPIPPTIVGDQLSHPIKAAVVGWAVTSPAAPTTPTTGLPVLPVMASGAGLLALGLYLALGRTRRAAS
jgi:hypothetical protein